jgi:hypothetical protein
MKSNRPTHKGSDVLKLGCLIYLLLALGSNSLSADEGRNKKDLSFIDAMQNVMDEDERLSSVSSNAIAMLDQNKDESVDKVAGIMREYVQQARQINLKSCPQDFTKAYVKNLAANESLADIAAEHPHVPGKIEAQIAYNQTKFQEGPDAWLHRYDDAAAKVLKTWADVTNVFEAYKQGRSPKVVDDAVLDLNTPTITNLVSHCSNGAFHDTITVLNCSGQDLTRVLVAIELTNDNGDKRRVHGEYYWQTWKSGEMKKVGIENGESLYNVTAATVSGDCDQGVIGSGPRHPR